MDVKNLFKNYWWLILVMAYVVSPLDLLPLSAIDDAVVTALAVWRAYYQIKEDNLKLEEKKKALKDNSGEVKEAEIIDRVENNE